MKPDRFRPLVMFSCLVLVSTCAWASPVQFSVKDPTGAPFAGALVILKSLDDNHEVFRALTNNEGNVPGVDLQHGLYRVIATFPYGLWKTDVREFVVTQKPLNLTLTLGMTSTQDDVAIVGAPTQTVQVLDESGKPISGALVITRDPTAAYERRYKSDQFGEANVELLSNPTVLVVVSPPNLVERVVDAEGTLKPHPVEKSKERARQKLLPKVVIRIP